MKIPDELWRCPQCGVGYDEGAGLVHESGEFDDAAEEDEYGPDDGCHCYDCGWEGTARQIFDAAQKRMNRKPCVHCGGTGWTEEGKPDA